MHRLAVLLVVLAAACFMGVQLAGASATKSYTVPVKNGATAKREGTAVIVVTTVSAAQLVFAVKSIRFTLPMRAAQQQAGELFLSWGCVKPPSTYDASFGSAKKPVKVTPTHGEKGTAISATGKVTLVAKCPAGQKVRMRAASFSTLWDAGSLAFAESAELPYKA